jgi:YidC/Oxa1 family membrane protein insertase
VESPLYRYVFSTRGGRLVGATAQEYSTFTPGDSGKAQIIPDESRFLEYALVVGNDTVRISEWSFRPSVPALTVADPATALTLTGQRGPLEVSLTYTFHPDRYHFDVVGEVRGLQASGFVVVRLGPRLALVEADSVDDFRNYAVVTKSRKTQKTNFRSVDPGEARELPGPFEWVAIKSKYFMAALLTIEEGQPQLGGAIVIGGPKPGRHATDADVLVSLPAPGGRFVFASYVGPQEYRRLARMGHSLPDVNPYGWIFRPIIRPFANLIVVILLWMHETLSLGYGWVLLLFGLIVRLVLWPLNQKAMRSSMAMQAVQPELKAVQEKYKQDPQRMQKEVMKLYKEHGVNPLGGCLPMLIPMPVLFALFFVFRETIEFRGVPFLWLPDLSRADPLYIIPVVMGISMFGVSKIGQIGIPPNPQTKMMTYVMPFFLTFIFLKLSSGLNLYYAVSNIASIPQQWLISRERLRRLGKRE